MSKYYSVGEGKVCAKFQIDGVFESSELVCSKDKEMESVKGIT